MFRVNQAAELSFFTEPFAREGKLQLWRLVIVFVRALERLAMSHASGECL
jgi:hypothetical protein